MPFVPLSPEEKKDWPEPCRHPGYQAAHAEPQRHDHHPSANSVAITTTMEMMTMKTNHHAVLV